MSVQIGDAGPVCLSCGLCCDGTLFARTQLAGEEIVRLGRRGATLSSAMTQPCSYHHDGRCEIYEQRPQVCRTFRCTALQRHESGQVDRGSTLHLIETARTARDAVMALLPPAMSLHDLRHRAAANDSDSVAWCAAHAEVLDRLSVLEDCLREHFRPPGCEGADASA